MELTISTNFDLSKLDIAWVNQVWLTGSSERIKTQAQDNAPFQSGKLRQSIGIEPWLIRPWDTQVKIWPRKVVYAVVREFVNYKNPWRKFYMKRAFDSADSIIKEEFERAVDLFIKKIKK